MKAMVLAAGLGTRLRPLTNHRPKALVEVGGRTLLEITLTRLRDFGVREVIINVHHFADMIEAYLKANNNFDLQIEISREEALLNTGGGLKKAGHFFGDNSKRKDSGREEPFILHNVDVISNIDFAQMLKFHTEKNALATLAVQDRETSRYLLFDDSLQLSGRQTGGNGKPELVRPTQTQQRLAFSGIHVISPRFLAMMTEQDAFSIIDSYLRLAGQGEKILAFRADKYYWRDLGRPEHVEQAAKDIARGVLQ
ncbi:MAG: Nucleotidyl transferase [Acidobacteriaceae bacterium]|nr:Nucleotidyl transferase [Acidobacteriaceae bacterium]